LFFFSSRRRHTRCYRDWSSDVCSSDLVGTSSVTLAGALRAGSLVPSGSVTVTLDGAGSQQVAIGLDGSFSATFVTGSLPIGAHEIGRASCRERVEAWGVEGGG